jgi:hypothetical protein
MTNPNNRPQRLALPHDVPASTRQAMERAVYRSLLWQGACDIGATISHAPPIMAVSFIPGPGTPSSEDLREARRAAAHAFGHGCALLLLSDHADTREAARSALLSAFPAAGCNIGGLLN